MSKIAWRPCVVLAAFSLLQALITVAIYTALGIVLPLMVKDLSWNWTEAGFGFTVIGGCIGGSSYLPALLIRRVGVRATLLAGTALVTLGLFGFSAAHGLAVYLAGAALCGVGYQMMALIPANYVLSRLFTRKSTAFGVYFTLASAFGAAGPFMVLGLLHLFGGHWRELWLSQSAFAVVIGSVCALIIGDPGALAVAAQRARADDGEAPRKARKVYRTTEDWTLAAAVRTPQFYVLLAAYFGHVVCLATTASFTVAHLGQRGVSTVMVGAVLTLEALMGVSWRLLAGVLGDLISPKYLLMGAVSALVVGMSALSVAHGLFSLIVFAVGVGIGTTVTALAVMVLVGDYYGHAHNLEIFSTVCLVGAASAFGPLIGGLMRDQLGGFGPAFQVFAALNAIVFAAVALMRPPHPRQVLARTPPVPTTKPRESASFIKDVA